MPLIREWSWKGHALAAIWEIQEPEVFFKDYTGLEVDIKNDRRRTEHLAGRFLLKHLQQDFPLLQIDKDPHDKPRIAQNQYFFSISHSWPYVAAVIDPRNEAGIDIQTYRRGMRQIAYKFLSEEEQKIFADERLLTLAWAAKEAAYKWAGRRGTDFIRHLPVTDCVVDGDQALIHIDISIPGNLTRVALSCLCFPDFVCAWVSEVHIPDKLHI